MTKGVGSEPIAEGSAVESLTITYRSLRLALVLAVGMIGVAIVAEVVRSGDLRGSISEYFYSPVRSIFVGALLVIGFSLVAIHVRHRREEALLTLGGMLAIIVALVPTGQPKCSLPVRTDGALTAGDALPQPLLAEAIDEAHLICFPLDGDGGLPDWVMTGIWNNLLALLFASVVALVLAWRYSRKHGEMPRRDLRVVLFAYGGMLAVGTLLFVVWDGFRDATHFVAAIATFVCVGITAAINGWGRSAENPERYCAFYRYVTIAMAAFGVAFIALRVIGAGFDNDIFWLEAIELVLFGGFWLAQTIQHWNDAA